MLRPLVLAIFVLVAMVSAQAQLPVNQVDSSAVVAPRISLLTCSPGADIYELEGHTGLRIQTPESDMVVHWGLFDFSAPNFVYRFVKGETDYRIGIIPSVYFLDSYSSTGRYVAEQVLNLTSDEAIEVVRLVDENLRPQNRVYRYNYVKDNCATRPIGIVERAVGDSILFGQIPKELGTQPTYRSMMNYYHEGYPWYQFGIDIALGSGIDYPISAHEAIFAPVVLCDMLDKAVFTHSGMNVVNESVVIAGNEGVDVRLASTPWYLTPCAVGCYLLLMCIAVSVSSFHRHQIIRWFYALVYALIGVVGCIVAFLVFISVHEATTVNWQILWLNPLALLVPLCVWSHCGRKVVRIYFMVNLVALLLLTVGLMCGVQSMMWAFAPYILSDALLSAVYLMVMRHEK